MGNDGSATEVTPHVWPDEQKRQYALEVALQYSCQGKPAANLDANLKDAEKVYAWLTSAKVD